MKRGRFKGKASRQGVFCPSSLGRVKNFIFIFQIMRVESMNYCFKGPPPKNNFKFEVLWLFCSIIEVSFHRFIWEIKKLLIFFMY
jgi:hypothetical protein